MALDPNFVIAPSLQSYFVSKDTGLPLTNGYIRFFIDGTNIPKPVYELSGTFPDYTYTVLPNPLSLSSVGTPLDPSGNDIIIYYFPFDGTPDAPGNVQLYTIAVYDMNGVLQFTRNAWPNFSTGTVNVNDEVTNLIPNGQFVLHNNIPASAANNYVANKVTADSTNIAPGNWFFDIGPTSTATNLITFPEYTSPIQEPTGNPRYAVQIVTSGGSDTVKDLCIRFPNVNSFSSSSTAYNLYFEAMANGSSISNVQLLIGHNFGTGGSPSASTETIVTSFTLTTAITPFNTELIFPPQTGKSLGTNNDDYVEICIRLPTTASQSALFTNFALTLNNSILTQFPSESEIDQIARSFDNSLNPPNEYPSAINPLGILNYDLYLPMTWTPNGLQADHTVVGKINAAVYHTANIGELLCDGSQYLTSDFDSNGIPYQRLQSVLYDEGVNLGVNIPLYGTGSNFATAYTYNTGAFATSFRITTNKPGAQAAIVDHGTTFTIPAATAAGTTTNVNAYNTATNALIVYGIVVGSVGSGAANVSVGGGFTVTQVINNSLSYQIFTLSAIPTGAGITGGQYFTYNTNSGTNYYVWFKVDGVGADPAVGGRTGILVNIASTFTAIDVTNILREVLNGFAISSAQTVAAGSIVAGSYFTFAANSVTYYVWYQVNSSGTAPVGSAATTAIKVILTGSETAAQVVTATQQAINKFIFAVPDFRGAFLRGVRGTGMWDVNAASRWSVISGVSGNSLGTFEPDTFQSHIHNYNQASIIAGAQLASAGATSILALTATATTATGNAETQPINAYVNWFIKM